MFCWTQSLKLTTFETKLCLFVSTPFPDLKVGYYYVVDHNIFAKIVGRRAFF